MGIFWLVIGFLGQALFASRFLVQWYESERRHESVIPVAFWWLSLTGAAVLLFYAISRRDPVIICGQAMGMVVYVRNLMLVRDTEERNSSDGNFSPGSELAQMVGGHGLSCVSGDNPMICSTAKPISEARIRVSPTRTAETPAA